MFPSLPFRPVIKVTSPMEVPETGKVNFSLDVAKLRKLEVVGLCVSDTCKVCNYNVPFLIVEKKSFVE